MTVSYDQLPDLTGKLKRAAIDAYMKSQQWEIQGEHYEIPGNSTNKVTRPGANGDGGGDWSGEFFQEWFVGGSRDEEFQGAFNDIRSKIDGLLKPWKDLPDPGEFDGMVESMRKANGLLALSTSTSGGQATGAGSIAGNLDIIKENSDAMSGGTISAFKQKFLLQLGKAIGGHHAITVILGSALTSEQKLWTEGRQDVADAVHAATEAFNKYAKGDDADLTIQFKVAGAVVAGVAAFASGGASAVLTGAGTGLTILTALSEESQKNASKPPGKDYNGLMEGFKTALEELDKAITNEEKGVRDNLSDNLGKVRSDSGSYDLTDPLNGADDDSDLHSADSQAIIHNRSLVFEITDTAMPGIADDLKSARGHVVDSLSSTPFYRDPSIGIAENGCYPQWLDLQWVLWELLGDLDWEVRNGATTLKLAIEDMGQVDTDAKDALEKHAEKTKEGSGYTPFN